MNNRRCGEGRKRRETDSQTRSEKQGDSIRDRKNNKKLEEQEGGKEEHIFKTDKPSDMITLKKIAQTEQEGKKPLGSAGSRQGLNRCLTQELERGRAAACAQRPAQGAKERAQTGQTHNYANPHRAWCATHTPSFPFCLTQ